MKTLLMGILNLIVLMFLLSCSTVGSYESQANKAYDQSKRPRVTTKKCLKNGHIFSFKGSLRPSPTGTN